nr:MAG TPA: hypothetical protein [Caudoviricetes sp.]
MQVVIVVLKILLQIEWPIALKKKYLIQFLSFLFEAKSHQSKVLLYYFLEPIS